MRRIVRDWVTRGLFGWQKLSALISLPLHIYNEFVYTQMSLKSALCGARQGTLWLKWSGFKCLCPSCAALMSISHVSSTCKSILLHSLASIYWALNILRYWWHWELRHLFYALNCWHSEHDRCWHSELYISLVLMAFVRRQGLLGHCRILTVSYVLPPPAFLCLRIFANLWPR